MHCWSRGWCTWRCEGRAGSAIAEYGDRQMHIASPKKLSFAVLGSNHCIKVEREWWGLQAYAPVGLLVEPLLLEVVLTPNLSER